MDDGDDKMEHLSIVTHRPIAEGEELTMCYAGQTDQCHCVSCKTASSDPAMRHIQKVVCFAMTYE